jgi:hypothetical protein
MYLSPGMEKTTCASNQVKDAGLCYKKCRNSYKGVGPVCWGQPPTKNGKKWVNCGMGAATDGGTCASIVMDQVTGPAEVAVFLSSAGVSSGTKSAENAAKIKSQMLSDTADKKDAYETLWKAILDVISAAKSKNGATLKSAAKTGLLPLIGMIDDTSSLASTIKTFISCSGVACFRGVAELMALVDPTGLAGTAAAYAYPKCDKV